MSLEGTKGPDVSYLDRYQRATLAEDIRYQQEVLSDHPTVFFRPGNRTDETRPGFLIPDENGLQHIRFITKYGDHATEVPPEFADDGLPVKVLARDPKKISEITNEECAAAYEELKKPETVLRWLQQKYPKEHLSIDSTVTVYTVEYSQNEKQP